MAFAPFLALALICVLCCSSPQKTEQEIACTAADVARASEIMSGSGSTEDKLIQVLEQVGPDVYRCLETAAVRARAKKLAVPITGSDSGS